MFINSDKCNNKLHAVQDRHKMFNKMDEKRFTRPCIRGLPAQKS